MQTFWEKIFANGNLKKWIKNTKILPKNIAFYRSRLLLFVVDMWFCSVLTRDGVNQMPSLVKKIESLDQFFCFLPKSGTLFVCRRLFVSENMWYPVRQRRSRSFFAVQKSDPDVVSGSPGPPRHRFLAACSCFCSFLLLFPLLFVVKPTPGGP